MTGPELSRTVKAHARDLGFDAVGITDLQPPPHAAHLRRWLEDGYAGTMRYMHRQAERRLAPDTIVPGATRAVVVLKSYPPEDPPGPPDAGHVARYARGPDYHTTIATPLHRLADAMVHLGASPERTRAFVDAGPVPERELAQRAGLGWIGKNTMLIAPGVGSYFFIATVFTDLELDIDAPFTWDRCGSCRRCLDACPTDAFPDARVLDARRCISYLTIEHRGPLPADVPTERDGWIFGCDTCQEVCPWNERFATSVATTLPLEPQRAWIPLTAFDDMTKDEFAAEWGPTPLERPGLAGMRRNAAALRAAEVSHGG